MKAVAGCLASLAWFGLIALFMLGTMMGDCFPGMGHTCPTDYERNISLLVILFGGVVIYLLVMLVIVRLSRRASGD
ncbi:MAG TPA: hypothetical protein VNJ10_01655 [Sphingomonas sp.]|nr:hypothetical protein [Sphingomonas sp.]